MLQLLLFLCVLGTLLRSPACQFASQYPVCPTNSEIYRTPGTDSPKICSGDQFTTCPQGYECYYGYGSAYGYCCSISSRQTFGQIVSNPFYQQCYDDYPTYCNLNRAYCSQYPVFQQSCKKTCGACTDRRYSTCPNGQPGGKICTYTSECPVYSSCVNSVCCPQFNSCPDGSQPRQQCESGGFCPSGSYCQNGGCCQDGFSGSFSTASNCHNFCQSTLDCPSFHTCTNGRCCQSGTSSVGFGNLQQQNFGNLLFPGRCNQEISQTSSVFTDPSNVFRPRCTTQGFYEMIQCTSSSRSCWCVDPETGTKILTSESYGYTPSCTSCIQKKSLALVTYNSQQVSAYIPQCTSDGNWAARQCSPSAGVCWCVNKYSGVEISGTRAVPGQPEQIC